VLSSPKTSIYSSGKNVSTYYPMIKLKNLLLESNYQYGCVMAQVPNMVAKPLLDLGQRLVPDNILYHDPMGREEYGRETELHTTIKFGLTQTYSKEQMEQFIRGTKPFYITIWGLDVFENENFDVIKLNVDGPELRRLRQIFDAMPNTDSYKDYKPHMTIAYVQSGMGKGYKGKSLKAMPQILIDTIKYSYPTGKLYFKL
jgi:hypothetical protein